MQIISNKRAWIVFILIWAGVAEAAPSTWKCEKNGALRETTAGRETTSKSSYCYKEPLFLLIADCFSQKCDAKTVLNVTQEEYTSPKKDGGNRLFYFCMQAKGSPRFVEYKTPEGWVEATICLFQSDGSFASMSYWENESLEIQ